MAVYVTSFDVEGDIQTAFDYLADFSNSEQWDPGVPRATKLGSGPPREGTTFEVDVSFLGTTTTMVYEIVRLERPNLIVLEASTSTLLSRDEISLIATPEGIHVTYNARLTLPTLLSPLDAGLQFVFNRIGDRARDGLIAGLRSELGLRPRAA